MTKQPNASSLAIVSRWISPRGLMVALAAVAGGLAVPESAFAINEFKLGFVKKYAGDGAPAEFKGAVETTGCNICHVRGKNKRERNEYGMALSKFLKVADFQGNAKKFEGGAAEKAIADALNEAEKEKSKSGATFGEVIKQGKLPAAAQ